MSDKSPQQQDSPGSVNWAAALEATDGDEELLLEIVKVFIDEAPSAMSGIRRAIDQRDAKLLRRSAHTLKGSLRIFECSEAATRAWQIEQIGKKPDPPDEQPLTDEDWEKAGEVCDLLNKAMSPILADMEERAKS